MKAFYYIVLIFLPASLIAQTYELQGPIVDQVRLESDIGTHGVVVGLVRINPAFDSSHSNREILALSPKNLQPDHLCVMVNTVDGLYSGKAEYARSAEAEAEAEAEITTKLPYETDKEEIYKYSAEDVAVLTTAGQCDSNSDQVLVSSWRAPDEQLSDQLLLLVNSSRADAVFIVVNGQEFDCIALTAGERAAFDFRCPFPSDLVSNTSRVQIFREKNGSIGLGIPITLVQNNVW